MARKGKTKKIKFRPLRQGITDGILHKPGCVAEIEAKAADRWIENNYADESDEELTPDLMELVEASSAPPVVEESGDK